MIKKILALFGLVKPLSTIQHLSEDALSEFKSTLAKLKSTEEKILSHHTIQDQAIADAQKVKDTLNDISASNKKVIAKLEDFLG